MGSDAVYKDTRDGIAVRCLSCEGDHWIPLWGAPVGRIGRLKRIENPRYLMPDATGRPDTRETIVIPVVRNGYVCAACAAELAQYEAATERGRTAWIPVPEKTDDRWTRPLAAVIKREPKKAGKR